MTQIRFLLLLMVVIPLLSGAGCLQEQPAPGGMNDTSATRHAIMQQLLHAVTGATQDTLDALDYTLSDAAGELATTGLSGPDADAVVAELAAYHPAILSVVTFDRNGTILSAAPGSAKALIGQNIADQEATHQVLSTREPAMGDYFSLRQGGEGVVIAHPVNSSSGEFPGAVSIAFSPYILVAPIAEESMTWAPFTYIVAQPDGRLVYHSNPTLAGKQTFNETTFANFPEVLDLALRYSTERSGYAAFSFYGVGSDKIVEKETFWDTVGLHGTGWRVLVVGEKE